MLTKKDLIHHLAIDTGLHKSAIERVLDHLAGLTAHALVNDPHGAVLPGLGRLVVKTRAGRTARDPRTGASIVVPARRVVKFRAGKDLAEVVA